MIGTRAFTLLSVLVLASSTIYPLYIDAPHQTYVTEFYAQSSKIPPHSQDERSYYDRVRFDHKIQIVAIHATISAMSDIHVQIWLEIQGMTKFFHVNSGTLGTANSDLSGIKVVVDEGRDIGLSYWCDNMAPNERDFHASITIFYEVP